MNPNQGEKEEQEEEEQEREEKEVPTARRMRSPPDPTGGVSERRSSKPVWRSTGGDVSR